MSVFPGFLNPAECPDAPHRPPEGPNEDVSQCPRCLSLSWEFRPEGETYGWHAPDCSLEERHPSYCQPGGAGHPPAARVRGYWPEGQHLHTDSECCYRHGHHVLPHRGCPLR